MKSWLDPTESDVKVHCTSFKPYLDYSSHKKYVGIILMDWQSIDGFQDILVNIFGILNEPSTQSHRKVSELWNYLNINASLISKGKICRYNELCNIYFVRSINAIATIANSLNLLFSFKMRQ